MAQNVEFYRNLKSSITTVRDRYVGLWSLVGEILNNSKIQYNAELGVTEGGESDTLDKYTYDPSCRRAVETVCDYYASLIFPAYEPFSLMPPADVKETEIRSSDLDWYIQQSKRVVSALYDAKSGFNEVKQMFYRDWVTFGTAGLYVTESDDENVPFIIQEFGVDNLGIQDGYNSVPEYSVLAFNWFPQVIVSYFGGKDSPLYSKLPNDIRSSYESGEWTEQFLLYCVISKNDEYNPNAKMGKKSAKYTGAWFFEDGEDLIKVDHYHENPMTVARYARIRGEVYGRSDVSNFINTIVAINGIIYLAYQSLGKMADPAIGVFDNALAQDTEMDTDAGAIVALDSTFASGANPVIPLQDIGNSEPLTKFLLTYLQEELIKAFKLDIILPIVQTGGMTATEFVNRLALQSEVISGVLARHLGQIAPFYDRIVNICGRRPGFFDLKNAPKFVKERINDGKPWFSIKHNNAIMNTMNAAKQRDFVNTCNSLIMAAQLDQSIMPDIDMYDSVLAIVKDSVLKDVLPTKTEHKERKAAMQMQAIAAQQAQIANVASQANRNNAQANQIEGQ